jgi:hypothetical protein
MESSSIVLFILSKQSGRVIAKLESLKGKIPEGLPCLCLQFHYTLLDFKYWYSFNLCTSLLTPSIVTTLSIYNQSSFDNWVLRLFFTTNSKLFYSRMELARW